MKNTFTKSLVFLGLLLASAGCFAQTYLNNTTLSAALKKGVAGTSFAVASTSNIVAGSDLYVDSELMSVVSVSATGTVVQVVRGYGGTAAAYHLSGAVAWIIPAAAQPYALITPDFGQDPAGACTRGGSALTGGTPTSASTLYLPIFDTRTATVYDCIGNQFVSGNLGGGAGGLLSQYEFPSPNTGGTAYTSINSSGTTLSATTQYCSEIDLPATKFLTGLGILNGTTVGTDKHLVALYDSAGNLLANSALAGATSATASTYQKYAFTAQYLAVGPAQYFGCVQTNGTTDTIRMIVTGTQDTYLTKGITSQTFGTLASFTAPTTFTTAVGPYLIVY
jgi:hypothetical protein